jgi:hypothetical protein
LAAAASVVVSVAMFDAQGKDSGDRQTPPAGEGGPVVAGLPSPVPAPPGPGGQPGGAPQDRASATPGAPVLASSNEVNLMMANAPQAAPDFQFPLSKGAAPEERLQVNTIWAARAISTMFLEITTIGGYRQDPLPWHPNGLAIDVMIPNPDTPEGIELGNQIAGYALANAERWGVLHVIWRQGLYPGVGAPSWTADYGNPTSNHFDHIHIATTGGGYPTGRETYYLGSIKTD